MFETILSDDVRMAAVRAQTTGTRTSWRNLIMPVRARAAGGGFVYASDVTAAGNFEQRRRHRRSSHGAGGIVGPPRAGSSQDANEGVRRIGEMPAGRA